MYPLSPENFMGWKMVFPIELVFLQGTLLMFAGVQKVCTSCLFEKNITAVCGWRKSHHTDFCCGRIGPLKVLSAVVFWV